MGVTVDTAAGRVEGLQREKHQSFLGMPFVASYTVIVYWVFRGKTKLDDASY